MSTNSDAFDTIAVDGLRVGLVPRLKSHTNKIFIDHLSLKNFYLY